MEKSNHQSGVDTLTLQLQESLKYELLKRENRELKEEVARLRAELKKVKKSEAFIKVVDRMPSFLQGTSPARP